MELGNPVKTWIVEPVETPAETPVEPAPEREEELAPA